MDIKAFGGVLILALMALFIGVSLVQGETTDTESGIAITAVNFVAPSPEKENLNEEWIEIINNETVDENLAGWTLQDQQNHTYTFPDFNLKAGATVKIHTGEGSNTEEDLFWNKSSSIWNNGGDLATLMDPSGTAVSSYPKEGDEA